MLNFDQGDRERSEAGVRGATRQEPRLFDSNRSELHGGGASLGRTYLHRHVPFIRVIPPFLDLQSIARNPVRDISA
jgi:hypothetical protein